MTKVEEDKFWEGRRKSRIALDKWLASAPQAVKNEIAEKLLSDTLTLRSGRIVTPKVED